MGKDFNDLGPDGATLLNEPQNPGNTWPDPEALPDLKTPVQPFRETLLPNAFRPWIKDISDRMQCPPDFPAIGAIVSLAAVVGRKIGIRPKRRDDWLAVPNLWGAVIGRPGIMKTPALDQSKLPLSRLSAEMIEQYSEATRAWETQESVMKAKREVLTTDLKKAIKTGSDTSGIESSLAGLRDDFVPPVNKRYSVNDPTVEKLQEILRENPNGLLLFRDELTGWLRTLDREGHENDRAFYLEAWNGTGGYECDRIGRGTVRIPAVCLSILGGIQPGPLADYVREASRNGSGADGLLQRFQLLVWPDDPKNWMNVDRWPDTTAKNRAFEVFQRLADLDPLTIGAEQGEDGIPFLQFTEEAQEAFDTWREILETEKLRSGEPDMIEAALSKYRSLIPSLAILFHLVDVGSGPVGLDPLLRAVDWGDYLESHMRRVYSAVSNPALAAAHGLLLKIREGKITDGMTLREIYLKGWAGLDRESLPGTLQILDECGWARLETRKPGTADGRGRKSEVVRINPKIGGAK
ncbi:MAG: YfjI family protein [Leptospirales bacterium]